MINNRDKLPIRLNFISLNFALFGYFRYFSFSYHESQLKRRTHISIQKATSLLRSTRIKARKMTSERSDYVAIVDQDLYQKVPANGLFLVVKQCVRSN